MRPGTFHRRGKAGYILVEAVVSMGLLSVSVLAVQSSLRQAILVKGQAQDYTVARFILEEQVAKVELQPQLTEMHRRGRGRGDMERFEWSYDVSKIQLPEPELPSNVDPQRLQQLKLKAPYVAKIEAKVTWTRAGQQYEESLQTLWSPEKIWTPPLQDPTEPPHVN